MEEADNAFIDLSDLLFAPILMDVKSVDKCADAINHTLSNLPPHFQKKEDKAVNMNEVCTSGPLCGELTISYVMW